MKKGLWTNLLQNRISHYVRDLLDSMTDEQQEQWKKLTEFTGMTTDGNIGAATLLHQLDEMCPYNLPSLHSVRSKPTKEERNKEILDLHLVSGKTVTEIASLFSITTQRVSFIIQRELRKQAEKSGKRGVKRKKTG